MVYSAGWLLLTISEPHGVVYSAGWLLLTISEPHGAVYSAGWLLFQLIISERGVTHSKERQR